MITTAARGVVARVDFHSCLLLGDEHEPPFEAKARGSLMGRTKSLGSTMVVGDVACFERTGGRAVITSVEPRRNLFARRASGKRSIEQVVAANLDQLVMLDAIAEA